MKLFISRYSSVGIVTGYRLDKPKKKQVLIFFSILFRSPSEPSNSYMYLSIYPYLA